MFSLDWGIKMKFFVISDIHGSSFALEKVLLSFLKEKADYLIICGDFLNHGPRNPLPKGYDTKSVAAKLNSLKEKIIGIRGNCDSEVDQMMLEFPVSSPTTNIFSSKGYRIFVHHGHDLSEDFISNFLESGSIVVSGHTHIPNLEIKEYKNNKKLLFVNPGSISLPKEESKPGYAIIEDKEKSITVELISLEGGKLKSIDFN